MKKLATMAWLLCSLSMTAQQSNINLVHNPQKDTEGLVPFSASLNSPEVLDDHTVIFRIKAPDAKSVGLSGAMTILTLLSFLSVRVKGFIDALKSAGVEHEYYAGGHGAHDWSTWRHLLYYRFLPNLFK